MWACAVPLRRHADAAAARGRGGDESGEAAASRQAIVGEEAEDAAAEAATGVDPSGVARSVDGRRRRRWRVRPRAGGERGGEGFCGLFCRKVLVFLRNCAEVLRCVKYGLRVLFRISRGAFSQKRHRRLARAVGSPADGRDRCTVVL